MSTADMNRTADTAYARRLRELASDLADSVAAGEMTEEQANAWLVAKQEQWVDAPWG